MLIFFMFQANLQMLRSHRKSPEVTSCSILGAFGGSTQPDLQLDVHSWLVFCDQGEYIQKKMLKEKDRTWLYLAGSVDVPCSMNMYLLFPVSHFKFISQLRGCQAEPELIWNANVYSEDQAFPIGRPQNSKTLQPWHCAADFRWIWR